MPTLPSSVSSSWFLLPSPSSLCSPHDRPVNQRRGAEAKSTTLFRKPADRESGGLVSPINHLMGVRMPVSFIAQRGAGDEEVKWKGHKFCKCPLEWPASGRGCVNFFFLATIHRWAGSDCLPLSWTIQAEGRVPWGRPLCMIIITKATKSKD